MRLASLGGGVNVNVNTGALESSGLRGARILRIFVGNRAAGAKRCELEADQREPGPGIGVHRRQTV